MENNNIDKILLNANLIKKDFESKSLIHAVDTIKQNLLNLFPHIQESNKIDLEHKNGFKIDLTQLTSILNHTKLDHVFGEVLESTKSEDKKLMYGKQVFDQGTVVIINDGNTYEIIELLIKNILAGNSTIFVNSGFLYGTNNFVIKIVQDILEQNNINKNLVQLYITEDLNSVFKNYSHIDLIIGIGNRRFQQQILEQSKNKTIVSGYHNYDLYIEDKKDLEFINKILKSTSNLQLYIKEGIGLDQKNAMIVADIDEAIAQINFAGSNYSASIITDNEFNASKFVSEVKSPYVTLNTSPTIEKVLDISDSELIKIKTIINPTK